jgi:hypothetical protein
MTEIVRPRAPLGDSNWLLRANRRARTGRPSAKVTEEDLERRRFLSERGSQAALDGKDSVQAWDIAVLDGRIPPDLARFSVPPARRG